MDSPEASSRAFEWASILDQVEALAIPIRSCREVLDKVGDGEMGDPPQLLPSLAIALVALMDQAERQRERLAEHLVAASSP